MASRSASNRTQLWSDAVAGWAPPEPAVALAGLPDPADPIVFCPFELFPLRVRLPLTIDDSVVDPTVPSPALVPWAKANVDEAITAAVASAMVVFKIRI